MDTKLPLAEEMLIRTTIMEHFGQLVSFHSLRTRKSGAERYIDLHLVVAKDTPIDQAHGITEHLELDIQSRLLRTDVTIHVEPCDETCDECADIYCVRKESIP